MYSARIIYLDLKSFLKDGKINFQQMKSERKMTQFKIIMAFLRKMKGQCSMIRGNAS